MPIRLMIIEDDDSSRFLYRLNLGRIPDIEIIAEFDNAEEALARIPHVKPDVVIVDHSLPGMSGIEFAEKLVRFPEIKILIASGHDPKDLSSKLKTPHNFKLIQKDWSEENLERILAFCRNKD